MANSIPDAAFIIRACNAHDELVETLRHVLERLEIHQDNAYCQVGGRRDGDAIEKARAAIAKAEGQS